MLLTVTLTPLRFVGRALPSPVKSEAPQMRVTLLSPVPFTCAHDPGTRPPATYVAPFATEPEVSTAGVAKDALAARRAICAMPPLPWPLLSSSTQVLKLPLLSV